MIQAIPSKVKVLKQMWQSYEKQRAAAAAAGMDVAADVEKMRKWFGRAYREGVTSEELAAEFPDREDDNPLRCQRCGDTGWYFSEDAHFEKRGPNGPIPVKTRGMVICVCFQGQAKAEAVRNLGQKKEKKGGRTGEF